MSLFDRRTLILSLAALPLAACGFEPVYAPGSGASALVGRTSFDTPVSENTFDLVRQLERRLGRADSAQFSLSVVPKIAEESLAIVGSQSITRINIVGSADYTLRDTGSGQVLLSGSVDTFTSYSASGNTASTVAARRDARNRLMISLADLTVTRLEASAGNLKT
jgi:LPS-assembly lipoprotein